MNLKNLQSKKNLERGLELSIKIFQNIKDNLDKENIDLTSDLEDMNDLQNVLATLDFVRTASVISCLIRDR